MGVLDPSYEVPRITNADLTTKVIDGTGTFDFLMSAFRVHLKGEFDAGRITGAQYTEAYIALTSAAMQNATQFLLGRDAAFWQAVAAQQQAKTAAYTLEQVLPLQKQLAQEQLEAARAQTLDTRSDGTPVTGSVGAQKDLYRQQITSYKRDAEIKAAKVFTDAWTVQKTVDEGLDPPVQFSNANLDVILNKIRTENDLD
jgi:hypothetical protein